jgi:DNA-nicking Smr family endonuclease
MAMRFGTDKPRRALLRALKSDETELWAAVTRSIRPLKPRPVAETPRARPAIEPTSPAAAKPMPRVPAAPPAARPIPPPLAGFDRRLKRRIARGTADIDDRLDLHGLSERDAYDALVAFLRRCAAKGARVVLVITGKGTQGGPADGQRGVLRRQVPHWLALQPLRAHVLSFEQAHVGHGGEGALYVRLRRPTSSRTDDL